MGDRNRVWASGLNGIYLVDAKSSIVRNNEVYKSGRRESGGDGIVVEGDSSQTEILDNHISSSNGSGIRISSSSNIAVARNVLGQNGKHGILVENSPGPNYLTGNEIYTSGWSCIVMLNSRSTSVQANSIGVSSGALSDSTRGNAFYGVVVGGGHGNPIGPDNWIAHNGLTTGSAGVWVDNGATSMAIMRNSIFHNGGKGIRLTNGGNAGQLTPALTQANCQAVLGTGPAYNNVEFFSDAQDEGRYYEGSVWSSPLQGTINWAHPTFRGPHVTARQPTSTATPLSSLRRSAAPA